MESDLEGKQKGQWFPSFITVSRWMDWDRKIDTMMGSADARKILKDIFESLPTHKRSVIDEQITYSDLSERIHHLRIVIRIKEGSEGRDVWPIRNRSLDVHRVGQSGWREKLKVQVVVNPRKKSYVMDMGKLLRWLKNMEAHEQIKVEWEPPSWISKIQSDSSVFWQRFELPQDGKSMKRC